MIFVYSLFLYLVGIIGLPIWIGIGLRAKYRSGVWRKLVFYKEDSVKKPYLMVHGVSVGEISAARPFVHALRKRYPDKPVLVTTTTVTGYRYACRHLKEHRIEYYPYDFPGCVRRFLGRFSIEQAFIMETELWPNFSHRAWKEDIPVWVVNGRLSDRAFPRYLKFKRFTRHCLQTYQLVFCQTQQDSKRFQALGLSPEKIRVTGSMKFDAACLAYDNSMAEESLTRKDLTSPPVFLAASTQHSENIPLLKTYLSLKNEFPDLRFFLVPRKPDQLIAAESWLQAEGISYSLRSQGILPNDASAVYLVDTIGELFKLYTWATIVFVGKTLTAPGGGQNPLEPAIWGKPVFVGPHYANFREIVDQMEINKAVRVVADVTDLQMGLRECMRNKAMRDQMGQQAESYVRSHADVCSNILDSVEKLARVV